MALGSLQKYQEIEKIVIFGTKLTFFGLIPPKWGKIPWMCLLWLLVLNWWIIFWYWFLSQSAYLIKSWSTEFLKLRKNWSFSFLGLDLGSFTWLMKRKQILKFYISWSPPSKLPKIWKLLVSDDLCSPAWPAKNARK